MKLNKSAVIILQWDVDEKESSNKEIKKIIKQATYFQMKKEYSSGAV